MAAALALILLLTLAAPAAAGSASVYTGTDCPYKSGCSDYSSVSFGADPGEANDLDVSLDGSEVRIHDAAAPIRAGDGCRAVDAHTVVCSGAHGRPGLGISVGDGDDRVVAPATASVDGGDGNDRLTGGALVGGEGDDALAGPGFLDGGPGNDRLVGGGDAGPGDDVVDASQGSSWVSRLGPGTDVFIGGPDADWVEDDERQTPSRDRIDGGRGQDTISYETAPGGVSIDLAQPSQASAHDDVTGFESVIGSPFADRLIGSEGNDAFRGNAGDDVLAGRGGDDRLDGGAGADTIDGGPGDDYAFGGPQPDRILLGDGNDSALSMADYHRDRLDCGAGIDDVHADRGDRRRGCEIEELRAPEQLLAYDDQIVRARGGRWRVAYQSCDDSWPACRGTSRLRARVGRRWIRVARVRFQGDVHGDEYILSTPFRLPAAARRELRANGLVRVRVTTLLAPGTQGGVLPSEQRLSLRARARRAAQDR